MWHSRDTNPSHQFNKPCALSDILLLPQHHFSCFFTLEKPPFTDKSLEHVGLGSYDISGETGRNGECLESHTYYIPPREAQLGLAESGDYQLCWNKGTAFVILSLWPRQWCQGLSWLQNEISSLSSQWKNLAKSIALNVKGPGDLSSVLFFLFFLFPFGSISFSPIICGGMDSTEIWHKKLKIPIHSSQSSFSNEDQGYNELLGTVKILI